MKICDMCGTNNPKVSITFDSPVSKSSYEVCYECENKVLKMMEDSMGKLEDYLDEYDS